MNETVEKINEIEEIKVEKPYEFRMLCAVDVFPVVNIINKIGFKQIKTVLGENDDLKKLIVSVAKKEAGNDEAKNDLINSGLSIALDVAALVIDNLPKCENEIFKLLAQTSNLDEKAVRALDFPTFFEMILDFIRKEEFKDFIKAVSKSFK